MRNRLHRPSGFTLFEVILATSIFIFLAGAIYYSVSTSIMAAHELGREQIDSRKLGSFARFLRNGFSNLPAEAEITVQTRKLGRSGDAVDLVIRRAPGAFETGATESLGGSVVLTAVPDGRGTCIVSLTRFPDKLSNSELKRQLENMTLLPLLENVKTLRWRFWDPNFNQFIELWERGQERPGLVELAFQCAGETERICFFSLPRLTKKASPSSKKEQVK